MTNVVESGDNYEIIEADKEYFYKVKGGQKSRAAGGYGPIDQLLADDNLEEIMVVKASAPIYVVHRKYGTIETNVIMEEDAVSKIIEKIGSNVGRKVGLANPLLDARLPDGSRVNATLKPLSVEGSTITIRKFKAESLTITNLIKFGTISPDAAAFLWLAVDGMRAKPGNILVSGGTGSGKTTTLNCLAAFIPKGSRVISIEDVAELQLPLKHHIRMEARSSSADSESGGVTFDKILINTLRMRPDRLIVGEVRGDEAGTLFTAMNTGHNGCMGTVHANTASETVTRLTNPPMSVPMAMVPALDLIVMQNNVNIEGRGCRRVAEISEVAGMEVDKVLLNKIFKYEARGDVLRSTGTPSRLKQTIAAHAGIPGTELNFELEKRQIVLEYLVKKDITALKDVYDWIQNYYKNQDDVLDKIHKSLK